MLTFKEFMEAEEIVTPSVAADRLGIDVEMFNDAVAVHLYDGTLYTCRLESGKFWTLLDRTEFEGTREDVARRLYVEWYLSEVADPTDATTGILTDVLTEIATTYGLPVESADEMLHDLPDRKDCTRDQFNAHLMLDWFVGAWGDVQAREDASATGGRA